MKRVYSKMKRSYSKRYYALDIDKTSDAQV